MSGMLRDIVTASIAAQPDMEIVGAVAASDRLASAAEVEQPDVVILLQKSPEGGTDYWSLLFARPRMKVFAISDTGRDMSLYELQPHELAFADVSPLDLVAAIREALAGRTS